MNNYVEAETIQVVARIRGVPHCLRESAVVITSSMYRCRSISFRLVDQCHHRSGEVRDRSPVGLAIGHLRDIDSRFFQVKS